MNTENKLKKVLIITIGTGATGSDIAHGLFFSIKDSNPNLLVLIGSQKSFKTTLPHLENMIKAEGMDCQITKKEIEEINDFEKLHFEFSRIITDLAQEGYSLNKISVDYTSGTKAMSSALVSAALFNKVGSISYVYGERGEGGRVKTGTERRSSLIPTKIFSDEIIKKAKEYFNSYRFTTCIELLTNFDFHPDYQEKVYLILKLASFFDAWDKFDFKLAFELFKKLNLDDLRLFELKNKFENYYQPLLIKLKSKEESLEKLLDLIGNADRRAVEGRYDDAIARLYRGLEMLGQIEFLKEFNCNTSEVHIQYIPKVYHQEILDKYYDKKDGKIKIPLYGTFELLSKVGNNFGKLFIERWDDIQKLLSLRNKSILAHGNVPLNQKNFDEARSIIVDFLSLNYKNIYPIKFPFIE